ncbi:MAG TPA: ATP-binding protein [Bacteroidota bacterium]
MAKKRITRQESSQRPSAKRGPSPASTTGGTRKRNKSLNGTDRVRQNILFTEVREKALDAVMPKLTEVHYKPGEIIFDESTLGRSLYLIAMGRIRIKKYTKYGIETRLAILRENDFFGELSIIDGQVRSARAEAIEECIIMEMSGDDFRHLVNTSPAFAMNLMKKLSFSLRAMDQTFVAELEKNSLSAKVKMDRLNLLVEASKTVNSTIDIDKLLGLILGAATRSVDADRGTLYLIDEATGELWSKMTQGKSTVEIRLPIGKGLAGFVAKTGETINIADAYKDPRFNPEIDKRSGYRTHNVLTIPMRDKEGKIVGVFQFLNKNAGSFTEDDESFIDALSVHAAIAVENAWLAQEMVKSERLSAVGRMASTIIHDIKNPMSTLRLYAQVIKKRSGNEEASRMAEEIIRQVDRFVNMTQEILDFSRGISEIHLQDTDVGVLMDTALRFIEQDLNKRKVTLERKLSYTGACLLDLDKMVRVFYNLATNAADAMPHGGTLTVSSEQQDGDLVISFADTGEGISEEIKAKIFEPFVTFGKKHGTGLGLSIVKKIVQDHKGTIHVTTEKDKGTTFTLNIPLGEKT